MNLIIYFNIKMSENNEILIDNIKILMYELYTDIKTFLVSNEKEKQNNEFQQEITSSTEPQTMIKYLKNCIQILIDEKKNNKEKNDSIITPDNDDIVKQLKSYTKKLESDIKYYIKKVFTYKIQKDSLENKVKAYMEIEEEYEELKEKVKYENGKFLNNDRKDNEIIILRRENSNLKKEINKLEEKTKNFENKYNNAEETIKGLKLKVAQLNKKIEEIKGEIDSIKIRNKTINESNIEGSLNLNNLNINKNIVEHYNKTMEKNSLDRINIINNSKINIHLRQGLTNNHSPSNNLNIESAKNNQIKALSANTIDNINNRLIISNSNKIYSNNSKIKNIIAPLRNNQIQNAKKIKSSSVSKRSDESEKSELTNKYLSANNNLKYGPHTKIRSLNRINNRINNTGYLLPKANSNFNIKYIQREERNPYEHSALNLIGIKEFK